jgi:RimJ/RimL family protein N-acetyltransferase
VGGIRLRSGGGVTVPAGEKIDLVPLDAANAETVRRWILDPEVNRWMLSGHEDISPEEERYFFEESIRAAAAGTAYRFEIHAKQDGRLLGICGLEHVDAKHHHAEAGIFLAPPSEWGKGFAADALLTLLAHGFDERGLHHISIAVFPENKRARALYERVGFTEWGRDRQRYLLHGAFHDIVWLCMLEDEWRDRHSGA